MRTPTKKDSILKKKGGGGSGSPKKSSKDVDRIPTYDENSVSSNVSEESLASLGLGKMLLSDADCGDHHPLVPPPSREATVDPRTKRIQRRIDDALDYRQIYRGTAPRGNHAIRHSHMAARLEIKDRAKRQAEHHVKARELERQRALLAVRMKMNAKMQGSRGEPLESPVVKILAPSKERVAMIHASSGMSRKNPAHLEKMLWEKVRRGMNRAGQLHLQHWKFGKVPDQCFNTLSLQLGRPKELFVQGNNLKRIDPGRMQQMQGFLERLLCNENSLPVAVPRNT